MPGLGDILRFSEPNERIGLALSGGGFRAAFFHVGVLARLAEIGLLPKVEVISTVSGGSIVGAAYYLRLQRLPQREAGRRDRPATTMSTSSARSTACCATRCAQNIRARALRQPAEERQDAALAEATRAATGSATSTTATSTSRPGRPRERRRMATATSQIEMRELLIEPAGDPDFDPAATTRATASKSPGAADQRDLAQLRPQLALRGDPYGRVDARGRTARPKSSKRSTRTCGSNRAISLEAHGREIGTPRAARPSEDFPSPSPSPPPPACPGSSSRWRSATCTGGISVPSAGRRRRAGQPGRPRPVRQELQPADRQRRLGPDGRQGKPSTRLPLACSAARRASRATGSATSS